MPSQDRCSEIAFTVVKQSASCGRARSIACAGSRATPNQDVKRARTMFVAAFSDDRDCGVLRGLSVVLVDEPTEAAASCDRVSGRERNDDWWPVGWVEVASAVWPLVVLVVDVGLEHAPEVHFAEDQDPVEALGADVADESLRTRWPSAHATVCGGS